MSKHVVWEGMLCGKFSRIWTDTDHTFGIEIVNDGKQHNLGGRVAHDAILRYMAHKPKKMFFIVHNWDERQAMKFVVAQLVSNGYNIKKQQSRSAGGYEWFIERRL